MLLRIIIVAFVGAFIPLFGAGYVAGLADQESKALADIYKRVETVEEGPEVTFRFRCDFPSSGQVGIREVRFDPQGSENGKVMATIAMQRYALGLPIERRLPVSKEVITALIGGASGGLTLSSIKKVAHEMKAVPRLYSPFEWRLLPLRTKATLMARKTGRVGMIILGTVSGYAIGYTFATRQPGCESAAALERIKTKHYALSALASVLEGAGDCPSKRFRDIVGRVLVMKFQPTASDLS